MTGVEFARELEGKLDEATRMVAAADVAAVADLPAAHGPPERQLFVCRAMVAARHAALQGGEAFEKHAIPLAALAGEIYDLQLESVGRSKR